MGAEATMIDFTGLLLPLLVVASLVSGVAVTDPRSLYIDTITVPESMEQRGYTPLVFIRMMNDEVLAIEATAKTRTDAQKLRTEEDKGVVAVSLDMLKLTALVRAVQESSDLIEFTVNGEVVEIDKDYLLRLRFDRYGQNVTRVEEARPQSDVKELARIAAERIMKITDPQIYCAAIMQTEAGALKPEDGSFAFPKTEACIDETLPLAQADDRLWLLNLHGVVAFVAGKADEAAKHFRAAIRVNPDFSPALLNLGILYAHADRPKKAVEYFAQVFRHELPTDSPQTYAATYTEWADALVDLHRPAEAEAMFRKATETDPKYAEAYFRWAKHTTDPKRAAELTAIGEQVAKKYGGIYTDNLVGKLRMAASEVRRPGGELERPDDLEGNLGDVGLLAEPVPDRTIWDRLRNTWARLRSQRAAGSL
jgi:tetratricopeptide (TPR) repeat protein